MSLCSAQATAIPLGMQENELRFDTKDRLIRLGRVKFKVEVKTEVEKKSKNHPNDENKRPLLNCYSSCITSSSCSSMRSFAMAFWTYFLNASDSSLPRLLNSIAMPGDSFKKSPKRS